MGAGLSDGDPTPANSPPARPPLPRTAPAHPASGAPARVLPGSPHDFRSGARRWRSFARRGFPDARTTIVPLVPQRTAVRKDSTSPTSFGLNSKPPPASGWFAFPSRRGRKPSKVGGSRLKGLPSAPEVGTMPRYIIRRNEAREYTLKL